MSSELSGGIRNVWEKNIHHVNAHLNLQIQILLKTGLVISNKCRPTRMKYILNEDREGDMIMSDVNIL